MLVVCYRFKSYLMMLNKLFTILVQWQPVIRTSSGVEGSSVYLVLPQVIKSERVNSNEKEELGWSKITHNSI